MVVAQRNILQTVLVSFFQSFVFSMRSKVKIKVVQFMFLGINIFWALLRAHLNSGATARAKMSLSGVQNIIIKHKHKLYCLK